SAQDQALPGLKNRVLALDRPAGEPCGPFLQGLADAGKNRFGPRKTGGQPVAVEHKISDGDEFSRDAVSLAVKICGQPLGELDLRQTTQRLFVRGLQVQIPARV